MKKIITVLSVVGVLFQSVSFAGPVVYKTTAPFIGVTIDTNPGELYHLGYLLDEQAKVVGVYYENTFTEDPTESFKTYSLSDAETGVVIEQKTSGSSVYNLVQLQLTQMPDGSADIALTYLKNGLVNTHGVVDIGVRYDSSAAHYESFDLDTNQILTEADLIVNYFLGKQVGISQIDLIAVN